MKSKEIAVGFVQAGCLMRAIIKQQSYEEVIKWLAQTYGAEAKFIYMVET